MPISGAFCGLRDGGCGQHFVRGSIYRSPWGTFIVPKQGAGPTRQGPWAEQGWESGALGYPVSDRFCGLRGGGCGQHFQGGSIYGSQPDGRGVVVPLAIRNRWAAEGWENGRLGYPMMPAYAVPGGIAQGFQGGTLTVR
jgi:hypothetical protein